MDEQRRLHDAYAEMAARHGSDYHSLAHAGVRWMETQKRNGVVQQLVRHNLMELANLDVLEVGCGSGGMLPYLEELGAKPESLYGIDLQADRIAVAQERYPRMHFQVGDGARLPYADGTFQVVMAFTVFSSILDPDIRKQVANEIRRVLAVPGLLIWYDMRWPNPWNPHIRPVTQAELAALFPDCQIEVRPHTLLPPLLRRLAGRWPKLCARLGRMPVLCSHLLGGILQVKPL